MLLGYLKCQRDILFITYQKIIENVCYVRRLESMNSEIDQSYASLLFHLFNFKQPYFQLTERNWQVLDWMTIITL